MKRTLLSWSSGKDSAWSPHLLWQENEYEVVGLLTNVQSSGESSAMHAVRRSLIEAQAKVSGVPLWDVDLPSHPDDSMTAGSLGMTGLSTGAITRILDRLEKGQPIRLLKLD